MSLARGRQALMLNEAISISQDLGGNLPSLNTFMTNAVTRA